MSLIAASATGVGLAILLFVREQTGGVVVSRKTYGNQISSKTMRLADEKAALERLGEQTVIFELQGSLFFGTADQLYLALEPETKKQSYMILDMRRVQSVDVTATHVLELLDDMMAEHGGLMIVSNLPHSLPIGQDIGQYLERAGLVTASRKVRILRRTRRRPRVGGEPVAGKGACRKVRGAAARIGRDRTLPGAQE